MHGLLMADQCNGFHELVLTGSSLCAASDGGMQETHGGEVGDHRGQMMALGRELRPPAALLLWGRTLCVFSFYIVCNI